MNKRKDIYLTIRMFESLKQSYYAEGYEFLGFDHQFYKRWLEERFQCFLCPPSHKDSKNVAFLVSPKFGASSEHLTLLILSMI